MTGNNLTLKEIFEDCPFMTEAVTRIAIEREIRTVPDWAAHGWEEAAQRLEEMIHELGGVELTLLLTAISEADRLCRKVDGRRFIEKPYDVEVAARRRGAHDMATKILEAFSPRLGEAYKRFIRAREAADTVLGSLLARAVGVA